MQHLAPTLDTFTGGVTRFICLANFWPFVLWYAKLITAAVGQSDTFGRQCFSFILATLADLAPVSSLNSVTAFIRDIDSTRSLALYV